MERDLALAELALKWNILTQKELLACLREQGRGDAKSLGQIMVAKGILSRAELQSLIRELSRSLLYLVETEGESRVLCEACGSVYVVPRPVPKDLKCESCKAPVTPPTRARRPRAESVTRLDLVKALHDKFRSKEMTLERARAVVDYLLESICGALGEGKRVDVRRLGVFEPVGRAPRKVRNPRTGQTHAVAFRSSVRFKASKDLLRRLRGRVGQNN